MRALHYIQGCSMADIYHSLTELNVTYYTLFIGVISIALGIVAIFQRRTSSLERKSKNYQAIFLRARDKCKTDRKKLCDMISASATHPSFLKSTSKVPLFYREEWLPNTPVDLQNVRLSFLPDPEKRIELKVHTLPYHGATRISTYADAIEQFDRPTTFENNLHYRLIGIDQDHLSYSERKYNYFDKINFGEFLVYELAVNCLGKKSGRKSTNRKRLLQHLRGPSDFVIFSGICTLTMIFDGSVLRIVMHKRGKKETAYAMGTYHVIPAGEFQPSCRALNAFGDDFNLWKSIMREYAEELLNMPEHDGNSMVQFNYETEPFISLERERQHGNIKVFYLGTALDTITFQAEIMTVAVFKKESFDRIFVKIIYENKEGQIINDANEWGREFTITERDQYINANTLPSAQAILNIAWDNQQIFRNCFD